MLVSKGADANARSKSGLTALMVAAGHDNAPLIGLLIQAGAKLDARSDDGKTALDIAKENGSDASIQTLDVMSPLRAGAKSERFCSGAAAMRRRIAIIIALLASALAAAGSAAPVSKPASKQANKPAASSAAKSNDVVTHYAYLGKAYREPAPLSLLKPAVIPDEGLAGVRLGTNYNNQAGKFLGLTYVLDETMVPEDGDDGRRRGKKTAGRR